MRMSWRIEDENGKIWWIWAFCFEKERKKLYSKQKKDEKNSISYGDWISL